MARYCSNCHRFQLMKSPSAIACSLNSLIWSKETAASVVLPRLDSELQMGSWNFYETEFCYFFAGSDPMIRQGTFAIYNTIKMR